MSKFYTKEMQVFILNNHKGKSIEQLKNEFNETFNTSITYTAMKSYISGHKLKVGHQHKRKFQEEHIQFLRENVKGTTAKQLRDRFNKKFNMNVSESAIKNLKTKYSLKSETTGGQFQKGHIPKNKGKKGCMSPKQYERCKATMFKKGQKPQNYKPIGSERIDKDGYVLIKVAEPNKWRPKHRILWEKANGPIPAKHRLIFADGNRQNVSLDNLLLVSYSQSFIMNKKKLFKDQKELTKAGVVVARLLEKVYESKSKE